MGIALVALPAMAALDGYIIVKGRRSHVTEVKMEIESPRDPHSRQASEKRREHKPITIVKEVDAASPLYRDVLKNHERLGEVVIEFARHEGQSPEKIRLNEAMVTEIRSVPRRDGKGGPEEITFTYQTIEVSFPGGKKQDHW